MWPAMADETPNTGLCTKYTYILKGLDSNVCIRLIRRKVAALLWNVMEISIS